MAWNDDEFTRSRGELLGRTLRRGEQLRQRRRLAWLGVAPAVLLLIAVPAALGMAGDAGDGRTTVAAGGSTTTVVDSTRPPDTAPITAVPSTAPTTTRPAPTTTTTTTAPAVAAPTTTTSTTTVPSEPGCEPSMFESSLVFDKPAYHPGEPMVATQTYRNVSGQTCYYASTTFGLEVYDATGKRVDQGAVGIADTFQWNPFPPGKSETSTGPIWDQRDCSAPSGPCVQAAPGVYRVVSKISPFASPEATVRLIAA